MKELPDLKTIIGVDAGPAPKPAGQSIEDMQNIAKMYTMMLGGKVILRQEAA